MREEDLQKALVCEYGKYGKLWIFDSGMAYHRVRGEYLPFKYGPGKGFADLMGFTKVKITEDMVGKELPIFTSYEVKMPGKYPRPEQKNFAAMVRDHGGISSERVCSFEDIEKTVEKYL